VITKIYPSSSAFMRGSVVDTSKASSCPRYVAAQVLSGLSKTELSRHVAQEYQAIGALNEARVAMVLKKNKQEFTREVPFSVPFKSVAIGGRIDFVLGGGGIIETKATTSQNVYKRAFEGDAPEAPWVAQVASYLGLLKKPEGVIWASYYEMNESLTGYEVVDERKWTVKALDDGRLIVGQKEFYYTLKDLSRWYSEIELAMTNPSAVETMPIQPANKYESACHYCPLKEICGTGKELAQKVHEIREAFLAPQTAKEFNIQVNTKRRQENRRKKNDKHPIV